MIDPKYRIDSNTGENMLRLLMLLLWVAISANVHANFFNGNTFKSICDRKSDANATSQCLGYVQAIGDAMASPNGLDGLRACFPSGMTGEQAVDVVRKWITDHPETRHTNAAHIVAQALSAAFSNNCPK